VPRAVGLAQYADPVNPPMIPHVIVREAGLVIYKIYDGYWFFGRPAGRTGTSKRLNAKQRGGKVGRNSSIHTAKRTPKLSVNRIRKDLVIGCLTASAKGAATSNGWKAISKTDSC